MRDARLRRTFLISFLLAVFAAKLFLTSVTGLADDEAYYWTWSRHLDIAYFDHPAMVAWLIHLSTSIFGQTPFGVRFFADVFFLANSYVFWRLANDMFGAKTADLATLIFTIIPVFCIGGLLMVPDTPMCFFRPLALLYAWRIFGLEDNRWRNWLFLGAALGFGINSKYTMFVCDICLLAFMGCDPDLRKHFKSPKFWTAFAMATIGAAPILIWNQQHDWASFQYHLHDRQVNGGGADFKRWGIFWMAQVILAGLPIVLMQVFMWSKTVRHFGERRARYILFMSLPVFALFCTQALFAQFRPHWTAPAYMLGLIGIVAMLDRLKKHYRTLALAGIFATTVPASLGVGVHIYQPFVGAVLQSHGIAWNSQADPTNDLHGWKRAAREVHRLTEILTVETGRRPFVCAAQFAISSQLEFRLHETVWRLSGNRDAFDFWDERTDHSSLYGRTGIFVTDSRFERDPRNEGQFHSCKEKEELPVYRHGEFIRKFHFWVCDSYIGDSPTRSKIGRNELPDSSRKL